MRYKVGGNPELPIYLGFPLAALTVQVFDYIYQSNLTKGDESFIAIFDNVN
ncbi:MAG: hypothetical protein P8M61_00635 [Crocinitomicaceae bacterium]|jgi:hypothetical protein|nr:hypothetical protein [Crocinitomicaceae bacterium]